MAKKKTKNSGDQPADYRADIARLTAKVDGLQMNIDAAFSRIARLEAPRIDYAAPVPSPWWCFWR